MTPTFIVHPTGSRFLADGVHGPKIMFATHDEDEAVAFAHANNGSVERWADGEPVTAVV